MDYLLGLSIRWPVRYGWIVPEVSQPYHPRRWEAVVSEGEYLPIKIDQETADFLNRTYEKMHKERLQMEVLVNRFDRLLEAARGVLDKFKEATHGE